MFHGKVICRLLLQKHQSALTMLRSLKCKLDRSSLEKCILQIIRPIFEYASVIWDSAPRHDYYFTTIEELQISAVRIVTGTNTYASKQLLYHDTGWERLSTRRENQRLCLFLKIVNGLSPPHLCKVLDMYFINNQRYEFRSRISRSLARELKRTDVHFSKCYSLLELFTLIY